MGELKIKLLTDDERKELDKLEHLNRCRTKSEFSRFVELSELEREERNLNLTSQEKKEQEEMNERWKKKDIFC
ncbi:MAG: hypothetical protein RR277_00355 [Rikenellaceae bacterium]